MFGCFRNVHGERPSAHIYTSANERIKTRIHDQILFFSRQSRFYHWVQFGAELMHRIKLMKLTLAETRNKGTFPVALLKVDASGQDNEKSNCKQGAGKPAICKQGAGKRE